MAADKIVISKLGWLHAEGSPGEFHQGDGIETELAIHATNEEIMGKVTRSGGKGFDVLFVSSPFAER